MGQVSIHRALSSAQNGYTPSDDKGTASDNPHTAAIAHVSMPTPSPDNTTKPTVKPVNLGQDRSKTSMTVVGDESQGFSGLATDNTK